MTNPVPDPDQSPQMDNKAPMRDSSGSAVDQRQTQTLARLPLVLVATAFITFVGFLAFAGTDSDDSATNQAESIYDFALARPDSSTTTLATNQGKPMVVNYFAAWCPPCRRELPDFEAVHQALGDEVEVVGISRDNTTSAWLKLIESTGLTYDTFFEGNIVGSYEFVEGLAMPTTAFVSADGDVVHTFSGALSEEALTELIYEHLLDSELDS